MAVILFWQNWSRMCDCTWYSLGIFVNCFTCSFCFFSPQDWKIRKWEQVFQLLSEWHKNTRNDLFLPSLSKFCNWKVPLANNKMFERPFMSLCWIKLKIPCHLKEDVINGSSWIRQELLIYTYKLTILHANEDYISLWRKLKLHHLKSFKKQKFIL